MEHDSEAKEGEEKKSFTSKKYSVINIGGEDFILTPSDDYLGLLQSSPSVDQKKISLYASDKFAVQKRPIKGDESVNAVKTIDPKQWKKDFDLISKMATEAKQPTIDDYLAEEKTESSKVDQTIKNFQDYDAMPLWKRLLTTPRC